MKVLVRLVTVKLPARPIVPDGAVNTLLARIVAALRFNVPAFVTIVVPPNETVPAVAVTVTPDATLRFPLTKKPTDAETLSEKIKDPPNVGAVVPEIVAVVAFPVAKVKVEVAEPKLETALLV